jgi:glutathione peroxidase-family protein
MSNIYELTMNSISGDEVPLSNYRDQALLIVNLASQ